MRRVTPRENWPESWRESYQYDLLEVYGGVSDRGYAYAYAERWKHTLALVQKVARRGARILDVAAAQGNASLALAEMEYQVTWNDLRHELAGYVKLKHERGSIRYVAGDVFRLQCDECFDVVLVAEIIEHVAHPDEFLISVAQLVKRGGYIVMTTPNGEYVRNRLPKFSECTDPGQFEEMQFKPNSDGHIFLLHLDEVNVLGRRAGLSVVETRFFANLLTSGHLKTAEVLRLMPRAWVRACEEATRLLPLAWQRRVHSGMAVLYERSGQGERR